jgi:hypothetical protein
MNRVWTEEELDILRRDRAAKVPVPVTAAKLGRPVPATYARARLIGTLVQPHQSWDEASVRQLRELVLADPPITDKRIAAELGRTVTQIRWKMQDLGLIGVRDLSRLAKATASQTARPKTIRPAAAKASTVSVPPRRRNAPAEAVRPVQVVAEKPAPAVAEGGLRAALHDALRRIENVLSERLQNAIRASEAAMIEAAKETIAEKGRIDQRLADLFKQAEAKAQRDAEAAREERALADKARVEKAQRAPRKTETKRAALPSVVQGVSQAAPARPARQPVQPQAPRILVVDTPSMARPATPDPTPALVSGRGGWKSVRRDPARIQAQAKAKATNRADAVDLAQAAQAAIDRFIAERGVTKTETTGIQTLVVRLQARGYIVVREDESWVVDQRHRIESEAALVAFAEARGITLNMAA